MPEFTVIKVLDGDTLEVAPEWRWNGQTGNRVRPAGYNAPETRTLAGSLAATKLSRLILGKKVQVCKVYLIDRGRLVCEVYFAGKNLASYFPEYA